MTSHTVAVAVSPPSTTSASPKRPVADTMLPNSDGPTSAPKNVSVMVAAVASDTIAR
jgi:hypothetical protein